MKTFLVLVFSLTTALAQVASAEDQDQVKQPKQKHAPANRTQTPKVQRNVPVRPQTHHNVNRTRHVNPVRPVHTPRVRPTVNQDLVRNTRTNRNFDVPPRVRTNPNVVVTPPTTIPPTTTVQTNSNRNRDWNNRNRTNENWRNRNDQNQTNENWRNRNNQNPTNDNGRNRNDRNRTNENWRNRNSDNTHSWSDARRRHHRNHHNRNWWRSRYNRFILFGGGYYYWDNYYWYPAYGYDPSYNSYSYDEPIYGSEDINPGQTIASVQRELQRLGYYRYAVDGLMGPATRAAIANYQRDNGLAMTSAIDRPTLQSLGLD